MSFLRNVDLIPENDRQSLGQFADDRWFSSVPRRRDRPRFVISLALDLLSANPANARKKRPLIGPRDEVVIKEDAAVLLARSFLQRQGDQISEPPLRHRVLTWKKAVVRIQTNIRSPLHRFGEEMRSESSGQGGWNCLLEEEPRVRASP